MSESRDRIYAVRRGHKPGIYRTWGECDAQVHGYSGAQFPSFTTLRDAEEYLNKIAASSPLATSLSTTKEVIIYTDGACIGNPGPGGYGVVMSYEEHRKEHSAGFRLTTNNRMEILGCIVGLSALKKPCDVTLYSDSQYVVNTMTKSWALNWKRRGWKRKDKNGELRDALNADLWQQMLELCDQHRVQFKWVRGHNGIEGNERCDELARAAAASPILGIDAGYETIGYARYQS
jgi:ribonuclease HI